jgi:hypothetical protein
MEWKSTARILNRPKASDRALTADRTTSAVQPSVTFCSNETEPPYLAPSELAERRALASESGKGALYKRTRPSGCPLHNKAASNTLWARFQQCAADSNVVAAGCDDVVLIGKGMTNSNFETVPHGIWTNSANTVIAHLTIRDVYYHPIILNPGAQRPRIYNVRLINWGATTY